jgi:hypothetical protein
MEEMPKMESQENAPISKEQVIEALKANKDDPATIEMLARWTDQRTQGLELAPDSIERARNIIDTSLELADIYEKAGLYQEVIDSFNDAGQLANNYRQSEIAKRIHTLMDEFEVRLDAILDARGE